VALCFSLRYADAVTELRLRLAAAEAARGRAEAEAALLADTSARLLGQVVSYLYVPPLFRRTDMVAVTAFLFSQPSPLLYGPLLRQAMDARESLVDARRDAKQWEAKASEAAQRSFLGAAHHLGAKAVTSSSSLGFSANGIEAGSGASDASPAGAWRGARHLSFGRAQVAASLAWRTRGLDTVPANRTAKFKAPCWYPNQPHVSRSGGSGGGGGVARSASAPPAAASLPATASAAAAARGLRCLPYFYVAGPALRSSVALLRLLEHHPEATTPHA
jgi:hypothetical protein